MDDRRAFLSGRRPTDKQLRYLGASLAFVVAAIHLYHPRRGFPRLVTLAATGNLGLLRTDPRPVLFVLSGLGIVLGILLVLWEYPRRPIYLAGMVLVLAYLIGYFAWHLTGHGGFLPMRKPVYHGLSPVEAVVSHLREDPIARLSKITELLLLVVLVSLYRRELNGHPRNS